MKTRSNYFFKTLLLCAALCCVTWLQAQTLQVSDSTVNTCNNSGEVHVQVYGGTAPYTYTLLGAYGTVFGPLTQSSPIFTGLGQGYYNVIVSDVAGINNTAQPAFAYIYGAFYGSIDVTPAICPSNLGSETAAGYPYGGGSGSYSYQWSNSSTSSTISNVPVGTHYTCTITDNSTGCTVLGSDSGGMYQRSDIYGTFTTTPANCTNGTATVVPTNGTAPYTYLWSNGQTGTQATGLSSGYPNVTITDAVGCSAVSYTSITQAITITTTINTTAEHCNDANGTLTVSAVNGTAPFSYQWSSGQTTPHITGLSAGDYNVTMTDHNGCTAYQYGNVQKSTPIVLTTSNTLTSCTAPTGTVTVNATGGTAPYTYVWNCSPVQAAATATGLAAGYYVVTVADAAGCTQNQSATVSNNTTLYMSMSVSDAQCGGAAGQISVYASGGATPYHYLWNNGSTATAITGITQAASYECTVTDNVGCMVSKYDYVHSISPVNVSFAVTDASCIYTADGSATISASGGLAPYTYNWGNGQTTPTATGFGTGYYYANATDAHGCTTGQPFHVGYASILPCAVTLSGTAYTDYDANCAANGSDAPLQSVWIGCLPNGGYQWTTNGYFSFILPPGTYGLVEAPPVYHTLICPLTITNQTLIAGQSSTNNDFFNKPDTLIDLAINCIPYTPPVAGFVQHSKIFVRNLGNLAMSPGVVYQHALDISFLSSNPAPDTYDPATGKISWSGPSLASTGTNTIDLFFAIPSTLPIGHILNNSDTVSPIVNDVDTFNNYEDVQGLVVASYDPNYIEVSPKGSGVPGYISSTKDSLLKYVVHFQNTGSYPATYVTLKIPIDANLDLSTFNLIGGSHKITSVSADNNRMLTIKFDNINLADSGTNSLGSQGFAAYTFKQKRGLQPLNTINQQANIYFDYNTPVATNTALNTIENPAGVRDIAADHTFAVYPNPTQGSVNLDLSALDESSVQIKVYDMTGRAAMEIPAVSVTGSKIVSLNTSVLASGVYTISVNGKASYVQKLVKTDK